MAMLRIPSTSKNIFTSVLLFEQFLSLLEGFEVTGHNEPHFISTEIWLH